jgi:hypothetical protein
MLFVRLDSSSVGRDHAEIVWIRALQRYMVGIMTKPSPPKASDLISGFRGVYARVARRLNVSESQVSRVANGQRTSTEIETALEEELRALKDKLDQYF